MIAQLKGIVDIITDDAVVVDVSGVGYYVMCTTPVLSSFVIGERIVLIIETQVREDSITLYGFLRTADRDLFKKLIKVSGVSNKVAITTLSQLSTQDIMQAIIGNDVVVLQSVSGIGKKTAERIITELKDRLNNIDLLATKNIVTSGKALDSGNIEKEAISALSTLGYSFDIARTAIRESLQQDAGLTLEELIKFSLKKLSK